MEDITAYVDNEKTIQEVIELRKLKKEQENKEADAGNKSLTE